MRSLDFSSWQTVLSTLVGLSLITLIGVGVRLMAMQVVQQRRERGNRQINERLRTLIAAYKTLGGSFTGDLLVDPTHLRDLRRREGIPAPDAATELAGDARSNDRSRRTRDAVEAALSDIILLGTEEQVRLAANAASELVAGRPVETAALVVSLRNFIRSVLDLEPVPPGLTIPRQGPTRPVVGKGKGEGAKDDGGRGDKGGGGAAAGGAGLGLGIGLGAAAGDGSDERDT